MQEPLGNIIIVAAPSGGGKTSLVRALVERMPSIEISISHTTRAMRPGEIEGVDYYYLTPDVFMAKVEHGDFIEHATVFNHYYGTSASQINSRIAKGIDVVLDIDWQGALQIKKHFPQAVSVFILPPSLDELRTRLVSRKRDEASVIDARMHQAQEEIQHYIEFDYLIINDKFEQAAEELLAIVESSRLKQRYQSQKYQKLLSLLLS